MNQGGGTLAVFYRAGLMLPLPPAVAVAEGHQHQPPCPQRKLGSQYIICPPKPDGLWTSINLVIASLRALRRRQMATLASESEAYLGPNIGL